MAYESEPQGAVQAHTIIFQPSGRRGRVETGITLLEAARRLGVDLNNVCGGVRSCGKCRVRIEAGRFEKYGLESAPDHAGPWQDEEASFIRAAEKREGYRLACAASVEGDLLVFVPESSRAWEQVVAKKARDLDIELNPAVKLYQVETPQASLADPRDDLRRVLAALKETHDLDADLLEVDWAALKQLPRTLREGGFKLTVAVWMDREIIAFKPGLVEDCFGLAVDLGTTTMAAHLCSLKTGEIVGSASMMNPQCRYGEDVMARISYAQTAPGGLDLMQDDAVRAVNQLIEACCRAVPLGLAATPQDVLDLVLVGNTVMHHLFLGLDPAFLGGSPFPPAAGQALQVKARDLGLLTGPGARVFLPPNQAGFVGADNTAVLLAEEPHLDDQKQLIIDIGTNGEIVLGDCRKLYSASCATGPALEGAQLTWGMRAAPGAIEHVGIDPRTHEVDYKVVGREAWRSQSRPSEMVCRGICGSAVIDILAEMSRAGVITPSGRFSPEQKSDRFRRAGEGGELDRFVIAWAEETLESIGQDIVVTQKDIRQIQLAKGALFAGCMLLLKKLDLARPEKIKIAGAFGSHIDPEKALFMGLFPDCGLENIEFVGNAAGDGARAALLDHRKRDEMQNLVKLVEYVELTLETDFQSEFLAALNLPRAAEG